MATTSQTLNCNKNMARRSQNVFNLGLFKLKPEKVLKLNHINYYQKNNLKLYALLKLCLLLLFFPISHEDQFTFLHVYSSFKDVFGQKGQHDITQSADFLLRQALFSQYNRMVRPVLKASDVVNVSFQVDFKALAEVVSLLSYYSSIWKKSTELHLKLHVEPL